MYRRVILGFWLTTVLTMSVRAAEPAAEAVVGCDCGGFSKWSLKGWCAKHAAKPKDEDYELRKDFCRFVFGPTMWYLHPERYQPPLPPLPPNAYPPPQPMPPAIFPPPLMPVEQ